LRLRRAAPALALLAAIVSCRSAPAPPPLPTPLPTPTPDVVAVAPPRIHDDLPRESLIAAIDREIEAAPTRIGTARCSAGEVAGALIGLRQAAQEPSSDLSAYVTEHFAFARSTGRAGGALFTGYYEPVLTGRRRREGAFVYPLYQRPDDLIEIRLGDFDADWAGVTIYGRVSAGKLAPYHSRRAIDGDYVLDGRGLEIAWLDDPVSRYFLHVQGSGMIDLEDGTQLRVGFGGSNGRPYTSIGRLLLDEGALGPGQATAAAIQQYLRAHPERRDEVLFRNERYVFFREVADGPIGRLGVKLTDGRSAAIDAALYPLGALAYVETNAPVVDDAGTAIGQRPLRRLVLAQDTGAAITGPGRVDLFFGTGDQAGREAGAMSARGELYWLTPKSCAERTTRGTPAS
jgi:membrane-bound lytic murein transglycosylase A